MHKNHTESLPQQMVSPPSLFGQLAGFFALGALLLCSSGLVAAHGGAAIKPHTLPSLQVHGELPPPPSGVTAIKFGEFFRMPVGPQGLEPTEKLLSLNGKRVRLVGYMVREESSSANRFMLSPLPVTVGDDDENLADDLPPTTVSVHLSSSKERKVPYITGLLHLTGTLEVGAVDEAGGRVSSVRMILDQKISKNILAAKPLTRASRQ